MVKLYLNGSVSDVKLEKTSNLINKSKKHRVFLNGYKLRTEIDKVSYNNIRSNKQIVFHLERDGVISKIESEIRRITKCSDFLDGYFGVAILVDITKEAIIDDLSIRALKLNCLLKNKPKR